MLCTVTTYLGFPGGSDLKESACNAGDTGPIPGLAEGNGTHSSILALRILGTEEHIQPVMW